MILFYSFSIFLFGLVVGSFLNSVIWRLHKEEGIIPRLFGGRSRNRSYCPKCRKQIAWYDNIPILSFVMLRGKCRQCGKPISWQYPIIELITGLLFVVSFYCNFKLYVNAGIEIPNFQFLISKLFTFNFLLLTLRDWLVISVMVVIFVYDLRWYMILDIVTIPAIIVFFIINLFLGFSLWNLLLSGIIGGSFFLFQFIISKGKWIGGGDIRLGTLMGIILGWPTVLVAIIIGYFIGAIVSIGLILGKKKKWGSEIPLGIFLTTGTIITLFWGEIILEWYLH